jgi:hypothetical protein
MTHESPRRGLRATGTGQEQAYIPGGTQQEQEAFGRLVEAFPGSTVGVFEPNQRPDVIVPGYEPVPLPAQMTDGLTFAMGATAEEDAIWGRVDAIAWAPGEATGLVGPDGVGKTTIVHRLALGLASVEGTLLGLPIAPAEGRVLLVAADRPKQAARSMWRMLVELQSREHAKLRETVLGVARSIAIRPRQGSGRARVMGD